MPPNPEPIPWFTENCLIDFGVPIKFPPIEFTMFKAVPAPGTIISAAAETVWTPLSASPIVLTVLSFDPKAYAIPDNPLIPPITELTGVAIWDNPLVTEDPSLENESDKFLFSHAGISKEWLENNNCENFDNPEKIAIFVNNLLRYTPRVFNFTPGPNNSGYGDDTCQGPIWIRPDSLLKSSLEGITQVVGHTQDEKIIIHNNLILTDTLGYSKEFLVITDGVPEIRLIK